MELIAPIVAGSILVGLAVGLLTYAYVWRGGWLLWSRRRGLAFVVALALDGLALDVTAVSAQGTAAGSTRDRTFVARTLVTLTADAVTPPASETLVTVVKLVGDAVTAGVTTYQVSAGKTLRVQALYVSFTQSSTTVVKVRVRLRTLSSGACLATSPLVATVELGPLTTTAVASTATDQARLTLPDGLEFSGATRNVCLSAIATSAAGTLTVSVVGFEY